MTWTIRRPWRRTPQDDTPTSLLFFPDYRDSNPFQTLLFGQLASVGFRADPVSVHDLDAELRRRATLDDPGVFNLQWTAQLVQKGRSAHDARHRRRKFEAAIDAFVEAGGRLIWTIHNVLPHETFFREEEIRLCRFLADRASAVHVLSEATIEAVEPLYPLNPSKVRLIELASYAGWYPDDITRDEARARLGLRADDVVLATVGGIRPYKGHDLLVDWFVSASAADPSLRLLVAGSIGDDIGNEDLLRRLEHPRIVARLGHVPDDELQIWYRAADLAVLPYRTILNSSAFWLALTFGISAVAPRVGALAAFDGLEFVRLFDPDDEADLGRAITSARCELVDAAGAEHWRPRVEAYAAAHGPEAMGRAFAELVAEQTAAGSGARRVHD